MVEAGGNKLLIIAKEHLGKREERKLDSIVNSSTDAGFDVNLVRTPSADKAKEIIRDSIGKYNGLGVFGGDGSLRTGIEALVTSGKPVDQLPILFAIRGGSVNVFGKATGNYLKEEGNAQMLKEGMSYTMDVIRARIDGGSENGGRDIYFLSNASIGLIGDMFNLRDRTHGQEGGIKGYARTIPKTLRRAQHFDIAITKDNTDEKTFSDVSELFILNGGKAGFIAFGPDEAYDGKELLAIIFNKWKRLGNWDKLKSRWAIASKQVQGLAFDMTHPGEPSEYEDRFRAQNIKVELKDGKKISLQLDGDGLGEVTSSIEFDILEDAVRMVIRDQSKPGKRRKIQQLLGFQGRPFRQQGEKVIWNKLSSLQNR